MPVRESKKDQGELVAVGYPALVPRGRCRGCPSCLLPLCQASRADRRDTQSWFGVAPKPVLFTLQMRLTLETPATPLQVRFDQDTQQVRGQDLSTISTEDKSRQTVESLPLIPGDPSQGSRFAFRVAL